MRLRWGPASPGTGWVYSSRCAAQSGHPRPAPCAPCGWGHTLEAGPATDTTGALTQLLIPLGQQLAAQASISATGQGGDINGVYSNGTTKLLGQLALAAFANPGGLTKEGENVFNMSAASGNAIVGKPGDGGHDTIASGYLEMSNVDLASEFTNMILAERGVEANSRMITTSDQMLQDLGNMKQ